VDKYRGRYSVGLRSSGYMRSKRLRASVSRARSGEKGTIALRAIALINARRPGNTSHREACCGHRAEPDIAAQVERHGAGMPLPEWWAGCGARSATWISSSAEWRGRTASGREQRGRPGGFSCGGSPDGSPTIFLLRFVPLTHRQSWCPESDLNQRPTAYEAVSKRFTAVTLRNRHLP
jgi:hypothetical protein